MNGRAHRHPLDPAPPPPFPLHLRRCFGNQLPTVDDFQDGLFHPARDPVRPDLHADALEEKSRAATLNHLLDYLQGLCLGVERLPLQAVFDIPEKRGDRVLYPQTQVGLGMGLVHRDDHLADELLDLPGRRQVDQSPELLLHDLLEVVGGDEYLALFQAAVDPAPQPVLELAGQLYVILVRSGLGLCHGHTTLLRGTNCFSAAPVPQDSGQSPSPRTGDRLFSPAAPGPG